MLSPREQQQPSLWHRLKTPAAVSLACLAATLLIAAQAFRSHPLTRPTAASEATSSATSGSSFSSSTGGSGDTNLAFSNSLPHSTVDSKAPSTSIASLADRAAVELAAGGGIGVGDPLLRSTEEVQLKPQEDVFANVTAIHRVIQGVETVTVSDSSSSHPPKGVLLIFHGCAHGAIDWWYPSAKCLACTALPEEVAVTKAALRHNLVVVTFSSQDREVHRCWDSTHPPDKSVDITAVTRAWEELLEVEGWARLPHYALGGSSGGAFVLLLAQRIPLDGIAAIIMAIPPQLLDAKPRTSDSSKSWNFPPTAFVHMERDELTAEGVAADVAALRKQGVAVLEIPVKPRPLSHTFFAERIESVDNATSAAIYSALLSEGCVNATGHLVENPRSLTMMRRWQTAIREGVPGAAGLNLNKDESSIFEELNLAWASHELVSDHTDQVLEWFASRKDGPKLMTAVNPRRMLR